MQALAPGLDPRPHGGAGDLEVLAREGDLLLGPQPAHQAHELPGAGVAMRLIALAVAVGGEIILAGDDIDAHAAAGQLVQGGGRGGEVRRPPVARADGDQRFERLGARSQRGGDGEGVGTAPAGAQQGALPAVRLQRPGVAGQGLQAVVVLDRGVAAVARVHLVGDVPEELGRPADLGRRRVRAFEMGDILEAMSHRAAPCALPATQDCLPPPGRLIQA